MWSICTLSVSHKFSTRIFDMDAVTVIVDISAVAVVIIVGRIDDIRLGLEV